MDLAREVSGPGAAGFVNAVLRRVATQDREAWITATAPGRAADLVGHLAVRYSHPRWIVDAISASLDEDAATGLTETEAVLAASAGRPRVALCAVPGLAAARQNFGRRGGARALVAVRERLPGGRRPGNGRRGRAGPRGGAG